MRQRKMLGPGRTFGFEALESKRTFTANLDFTPVDAPAIVDTPTNDQLILVIGEYVKIRGNGSEGIRGSGSEGLMSTGIPLPATANGTVSTSSVAADAPQRLQDIIAILGAKRS